MSDLVRQMNRHLGEALKLIEGGSADNTAQIREFVKQFFATAEGIEYTIAQNEVASLNRVKMSELVAIEDHRRQVAEFNDHFDGEIAAIEGQIRGAISETISLLDMNLDA